MMNSAYLADIFEKNK